jgi:hypothetical protein
MDSANGNWKMNSKSGYRQQQREDESKQLYRSSSDANGNRNSSRTAAPAHTAIQEALAEDSNANGYSN